jgi:hypothetical protein
MIFLLTSSAYGYIIVPISSCVVRRHRLSLLSWGTFLNHKKSWSTETWHTDQIFVRSGSWFGHQEFRWTINLIQSNLSWRTPRPPLSIKDTMQRSVPNWSFLVILTSVTNQDTSQLRTGVVSPKGVLRDVPLYSVFCKACCLWLVLHLVLGGVAVGRGFEPQSDLELSFADILIYSSVFSLCWWTKPPRLRIVY